MWVHQRRLSENQSDFLKSPIKIGSENLFSRELVTKGNWYGHFLAASSIDVILRIFICSEFGWKYMKVYIFLEVHASKCVRMHIFCRRERKNLFNFMNHELWLNLFTLWWSISYEHHIIIYNSYVKSIWDHVQNLPEFLIKNVKFFLQNMSQNVELPNSTR